MQLREVDIVVISDVHLGTFGSKAEELLIYLNSIKPKKVILNGDFIDVWQFSKWYFPKSHIKVIRCILKFLADDIPVYYLTGNHDDMLRTFADYSIGNFHLLNKLILNIDGKNAWFFHGDFLDISTRHTKWLAKIGTISYHALIMLNWAINWGLSKFGKYQTSFSKRIKASVKGAVKSINNFEQSFIKIATQKGYSYVICGHSHHPEIKKVLTTDDTIIYLNSGDWVESLTALEYHNGAWSIYNHNPENCLQTTQNQVIVTNKIDLEKEYLNKFT